MHIWYLEDWKKNIDLTAENHRCGLRLRFDANIDSSVRIFCKKFAKWLRREFFFPIRVSVYVKSEYRIKARDGEYVVGTFFRPADYSTEPYIRLAAGDYQELREKRGEEQAMWAILRSFAHELTHYFQHINGLSLTRIGEERQATLYSDYILWDYDEYLKNGEHIKQSKNIWQSYAWEKNIDLTREEHRIGLRLRFDRNIDCEVRKACKEFAVFLRREFFFPIRIVIYIKNALKTKNVEYDKVSSTFWRIEDDYTLEPHICVVLGNYADLCTRWGRDRVLIKILTTIAYELTHYFQWINSLHLTPIGKERQATRYAKQILDNYAKTREHQ